MCCHRLFALICLMLIKGFHRLFMVQQTPSYSRLRDRETWTETETETERLFMVQQIPFTPE